MLKRLGQLPCAGLNLLEEPRVPNGNHRLVSEGGEELHLLGELSSLAFGQCDRADWRYFPKHWNRQYPAIGELSTIATELVRAPD